MIRRRLSVRGEEGIVLVTAVILTAVMLGVGLALLSTVDSGQNAVREQRERESALNLAEGALLAQGFSLASSWPGHTDYSVPLTATQCVQGPPVAGCPNGAYLDSANGGATANFDNVDQAANVQWVTRVRDNGAQLDPYVPANANLAQSGTNVQTGLPYSCPGPCRWDANGDKAVWVQARATVQGKSRNIVALLRLERLRENIPQSGVMVGGFATGSSGRGQVFVDSTGGDVILRCDPDSPDCANYRDGQVVPSAPKGPPEYIAPTTMMTADQLERLKEVAQTQKTYYEGCPPSQSPGMPAATNPGAYDLRGQVVWVGKCIADMNGNGKLAYDTCTQKPPGMNVANGCINQLATPGIVIWECGKADFSGNITFIGMIYMLNGSSGACPGGGPYSQQGTEPPAQAECSSADKSGNASETNQTPNDVVYQSSGNFGIYGALSVDYNGCALLGTSGTNLKFDPNIFNAIASYGTVGVVQNTWRELPANSEPPA